MVLNDYERFKRVCIQIRNPYSKQLNLNLKSVSVMTDMYSIEEMEYYVKQIMKELHENVDSQEVVIKRWQKKKEEN